MTRIITHLSMPTLYSIWQDQTSPDQREGWGKSSIPRTRPVHKSTNPPRPTASGSTCATSARKGATGGEIHHDLGHPLRGRGHRQSLSGRIVDRRALAAHPSPLFSSGVSNRTNRRCGGGTSVVTPFGRPPHSACEADHHGLWCCSFDSEKRPDMEWVSGSPQHTHHSQALVDLRKTWSTEHSTSQWGRGYSEGREQSDARRARWTCSRSLTGQCNARLNRGRTARLRSWSMREHWSSESYIQSWGAAYIA